MSEFEYATMKMELWTGRLPDDIQTVLDEMSGKGWRLHSTVVIYGGGSVDQVVLILERELSGRRALPVGEA